MIYNKLIITSFYRKDIRKTIRYAFFIIFATYCIYITKTLKSYRMGNAHSNNNLKLKLCLKLH